MAKQPRILAGETAAVPVSYPLRDEEGPKWGDVVAAVIIGRRPGPVRVAGVGHSTDSTQIGDRDLLGMPALTEAVRAATAGAGIALRDIGVIELDGLTLPDEIIAMEALGLCGPGDGFRAYAASRRINQSGGAGAGWCYPAMGLVRLAEAYLRLREPGGGPGHGRKAALATGNGAVGARTTAALVLEAE